MKLGDLIVQYRQRHDISQREFARRCGLSNSLISILEKGINPQTGKEMSPDLDTYQHIAQAMDITLQTLFEKLGNDATVKLVTFRSYPDGSGDIFNSGSTEEDKKDQARLEALHQNPTLRLLFDKQKDLSDSDLDAVLGIVNAIMKERGEE